MGSLVDLSHADIGFLLGCYKMGIDPRELGIEPKDFELEEWPWETVRARKRADADVGAAKGTTARGARAGRRG